MSEVEKITHEDERCIREALEELGVDEENETVEKDAPQTKPAENARDLGVVEALVKLCVDNGVTIRYGEITVAPTRTRSAAQQLPRQTKRTQVQAPPDKKRKRTRDAHPLEDLVGFQGR